MFLYKSFLCVLFVVVIFLCSYVVLVVISVGSLCSGFVCFFCGKMEVNGLVR